MSKDYYREGEYSEMQTTQSQEEILAKLREMKCDTNSYFNHFIKWLARVKRYSALAICQVVEKPYAYKKEYNQFIKEEWEVE